MRIDPHQKWHPVYLAQPFYNLVLVALFEWGVAFHDLDFDAIRAGEKSKEEVRRELKGMAGKARAQIVKDYIAFPALSALIAASRRRRALALRKPARRKPGRAARSGAVRRRPEPRRAPASGRSRSSRR